tara:strand:+ start:3424 stop:5217 length:1794 start_codon:yes stop_codon:yes gene_type:complete
MNIFIQNPIARLKKILQPDDIKSLYMVFAILLVSGIFETLGIASIIPFINVISDPEYTVTNTYFLTVIQYLGLNEKESKAFIGVLVISLFIFINLFNIFSLRKSLYFIAKIEHNISSTVLEYYLRRPYAEFAESSPATITKHILDDASALCSGIIYPLIQIISKSIIIILISILLIVIDYKVFISSFLLLSVIYIIIYKNFTNVAKKSGEERVVLNDNRFKTTRDAFNAMKEVKFFSLENHYLNTFSESAKRFCLIDARISFLSTIPKYILEIVLFGIIFSSIIYLILIESPMTAHLPLIGVFILAAYRAIPMLQNVYTNLNIYKLYYPVFNIIENIYTLKDKQQKHETFSQEDITLNDKISYNDISFSYSDNKPLIKNLSFTINAKQMTAFIGSTGCGKTTLIDILLGFYNPDSGSIMIDEKELNHSNRLNFNKVIGYVPQTINLQENSLAMNIALGSNGENINFTKLNEILDVLQLSELVKNLKNGIDTNIGDRGIKLSGGQRQRIGIARALYLDPKLLVLDESTNELDNKTEIDIINAIRKNNPKLTIVMITHRLSSLKFADNVKLFKNNKIFNLDMEAVNDIRELQQVIDCHN